MTIYAEYLFFENFIVGIVLIFFCKGLLKEKVSKWKFAVSGVISGAYSFVIFLNFPELMVLFLSIIYSVMVTTVAFGFAGLKKTAVNGIVFFVLSVLYGSIADIIVRFFNLNSSHIGGRLGSGIYMPVESYFAVTCASLAAFLLIELVIDIIRVKRLEAATYTEACIVMGDKCRKVKGLIDSGNYLKDPVTGRDVAIIGRSLFEEMGKAMGSMELRYVLIPYKALGTEGGLLEGYRTDYIEVSGIIMKRVIVATWMEGDLHSEFSFAESIDVLLPRSMIERGIYGDYKSS